jgi:hypothetical protein
MNDVSQLDDVAPPRIGRWRLWPQLSLRGAGFPAAGVLRLAPDELAQAAGKFAPGDALSGEQWDDFQELFSSTALSVSRTLQEIAALPFFQAAVAWQNKAVLTSGITPFLNWVPEKGKRPSMARQREELVAHYWQRFCVKNDTIGFFGPVGWGSWDLSASGVRLDPGTGLTAGYDVYFSSWAIDALARRLSDDPAVREWLAPRRMPFVRLAGDEVRVPGRPTVPVSPAERQVLELCDGTRPARDIARAVDGVAGLLADFVKRHWIVWRLDVPADTYPERRLRACLERIGDQAIREMALDQLSVLENSRDRIRAAGREPGALVAAMETLETEFAELTQTTAQRQKGQGTTAPCRALVYSDSTRSARVTLGTGMFDALAPLDLLLSGAAWLTSRLEAAVMDRARQVFAEHTAASGQSSLDLATCWFACMPVLLGDAVDHAARLQQQFWENWQVILGPEPGAHQVRRTSAEIADQVRACFGEPVPRWATGRYACPDLLVVADSAGALDRGEFELVLGELHLAINTVGASLFVNQHPHQEELLSLTSVDHTGPRLMPLQPKEHSARLSARTRYALIRPQDYCVALTDPSADPYRERTVKSSDASVRERDGRLAVVLPDGAEFDLVDVFSQALTMLVMNMFRIVPDAASHFPRVTVDRMIVARETWRFEPETLAFAEEKDEARRFVGARQWRAGQGLPRFVFVVSPTEPRPFYVDFDSPVYANIFAKTVRRLRRNDAQGRLTISEMVPTPEQTWLLDDQGNAYASELRFVAVDEGRG